LLPAAILSAGEVACPACPRQTEGNGAAIIGVEGETNGEWVLVDAAASSSTLATVRAYYNLQELWTRGFRRETTIRYRVAAGRTLPHVFDIPKTMNLCRRARHGP
jgi:hypothetical protein